MDIRYISPEWMNRNLHNNNLKTLTPWVFLLTWKHSVLVWVILQVELRVLYWKGPPDDQSIQEHAYQHILVGWKSTPRGCSCCSQAPSDFLITSLLASSVCQHIILSIEYAAYAPHTANTIHPGHQISASVFSAPGTSVLVTVSP